MPLRQEQLPVSNIDPAILFEPYLLEVTDFLESEPFVEANAGLVG